MSTDLLIPHGNSSARRNAENARTRVRGLTLKEYFRICHQEQLKEIKEESVQSSKSSLLQTPSFPHEETHPKQLPRFRTQVSDCADDLLPNLPSEMPSSNRTPPLKHLPQKEYSFRGQQPQQRKKALIKVPKISDRQNFESKKRSTMSCFYQIQEKQKKMIRKVQADKEKAQEMALKQALCITKYGRLKTQYKT